MSLDWGLEGEEGAARFGVGGVLSGLAQGVGVVCLRGKGSVTLATEATRP